MFDVGYKLDVHILIPLILLSNDLTAVWLRCILQMQQIDGITIILLDNTCKIRTAQSQSGESHVLVFVTQKEENSSSTTPFFF